MSETCSLPLKIYHNCHLLLASLSLERNHVMFWDIYWDDWGVETLVIYLSVLSFLSYCNNNWYPDDDQMYPCFHER